ncbi:Site-specific DNA-methyltransferase (adenine- specific) [Pirellula staleyi DSM 6068]|uniref:site-specific DNA-methyltransferase (adenine-specific) n=1 Tax=Pirellula staleyi (strain ATCC 27377 / DSM 6068 / ICPB 4128) TaxID=530564 RepID=D2R1H2_PIRSD|nr:DNA methyltransferase [Pirellula staleyi]ADB14957.1 Site-specific DNA-methyltransferase (adenine- specific) [Pirellula staleyi DSM 6068]
MPTLDWIGKAAVVNHHRKVGYHLLRCDRELSAGDVDAGNLLVQGDNLLALKALLPYYAGRVKCIYIDPPYNTGNEGWVYNDNVNSPEIRQWIEATVGKEGEDLSRHDKWLCMMYPRLALLRDFLTEDGVIFISIDDFEAHRLRLIVEEVFGAQNFIAQLVWDKTRKNDAKLFSVGHEYVLAFARSLATLKERKTVWREQKPGAREIFDFWKSAKARHGNDFQAIQSELRAWYRELPRNHPSKKLSRYKWVDQYGPWRDRDISWPGGGGPRYDVPHPVTLLPCKVPEAGWRFATTEEMQRQVRVGLVEFREDHTEPPFRKAHLLPTPEELATGNEEAEEEVENGSEEEEAGLLVMPSLIQKQAQVSVKLLRRIFEGRKVFPNPKDHEVLARLIRYVTGPNDIILDSFGGSGTTAHAVLQINRDTEGSERRFILVEMLPEVAVEITAERIRRVVAGVPGVPGLGGGFRFCKLGAGLFDDSGNIAGEVKFPDLAAHVFFTETGLPIPKRAKADSPLLGVHHGKAVYLLFNGVLGDKRPAGGNVLTHSVAQDLPVHPAGKGPRVVYGEACRLGPKSLEQYGITFRQVPFELKVD